MKIINELSYILSVLHGVLKVRYAFCPYSTSQFGLVTFQVHSVEPNSRAILQFRCWNNTVEGVRD